MKEPLSVLVLTTSFPTNDSSAGVFVWDECRDLVKYGINVTVVAPHCQNSMRLETKEGLRIVRFKYFIPESMQCVAYGSGIPENLRKNLLAKLQLPMFSIAFLLCALKESRGKQIIHCHWFIAGAIGVLVKILRRKKMVLMMHHAHSPTSIFRFILKKTDFLFCNSTYVNEATQAIFKVQNTEVLPVTVDTERFFAKEGTHASKSKTEIIAVGRLIPLKGFKYLIEAMSILVNDRQLSTLHLKIVGDGPLRKVLSQQIHALNLELNVTLLGSVDHSEMPTLLMAADIFVIPSIVDDNGETEGLGLVTLEAAACGLPVIGSNVGGIPDVIEDNLNGYLVPPKNPTELADKLQLLINDEALRHKFGVEGAKLVNERFSRKVITQKIISAYKSVYPIGMD